MPRISEATIVEHRRRITTALLDAWGALLSERGYADITLTLVAERAGVVRNTVYGYFPDKEALLLAYLEREVAGFMERANTAIQTQQSALDQLRVLIELQTRYFATTTAAGQDLAGVVSPQRFAQISNVFTPLMRLIAQVLDNGGTEGIFRVEDVDRTAQMIVGMLGAYRVALACGTTTAEQASHELFDLLLHGIASDPHPSTHLA